MITPEYCRVMARYNAWQNQNIRRIVEGMDADALGRDRGAFFGSIHATLSHLLWADTIWMSRFDGWGKPNAGIKESVEWVTDWPDLKARRKVADAQIVVAVDDQANDDVGVKSPHPTRPFRWLFPCRRG